jgi:oligoribonuclease
MNLDDHLVWIDLEMTGLDLDTQVILEIGSAVTDGRLEIVAQGPAIAVNHPESVLADMEEWSREHHQASGLMERVRSSTLTCTEAEQATLDFLSAYCRPGRSPLCGNSVWQDRRFLIKYMPRLEAFLHYRNIDVSSVKEIVRRWYPDLPPFEKQKTHLAISDITESIKELRYYRRHVFVQEAV